MTTDDLLTRCIAENQRLKVEAQNAVSQLTKEQSNQPMPNGDWSVARVLKHMILANAKYLEILPPLVEAANAGSPDVKHTWFGKALIKIAGPNGNVSPPAQMVPEDVVYEKLIHDEWVVQQNTAIELMQRAVGKNTNLLRFKNPFVRLFTMNASDAFAIMTTHTDRHVQQIQQRATIVTSN